MGPLAILPEKILAKDGDTGINEKVVYSIKLGKSFCFLLDIHTIIYDVCVTEENNKEVQCTVRCLNCIHLYYSAAPWAKLA